jgi:hypothetical protein
MVDEATVLAVCMTGDLGDIELGYNDLIAGSGFAGQLRNGPEHKIPGVLYSVPSVAPAIAGASSSDHQIQRANEHFAE